MRSSKQLRRDARQLFRLCLADGVLDDGRVRLVVKRVVEEKRRGYLDLLSSFQRLVKLDRESHSAQVESAEPLSANLQDRLSADLHATYGAAINVSFSQNPGLIGGIRVKVGSDVYDGSVRHGLLLIAKSF
jgi:F-type H+-transporting ATPase subunit delta